MLTMTKEDTKENIFVMNEQKISAEWDVFFFFIKKEPNRNSRNKQTKNYNIQNKKFTGWA